MSTVGQRERATQQRVVELLQHRLGYRYLGNWRDREGNRNVEPELLADWLRRRGTGEGLITRALHQLGQAAALGAGRSLYDANRAVYDLIRYGVKAREEAGEQKQTIWLIDWKDPEANDFAVAEEVSVAGAHGKRPDIVLYINGIALGVLELKRSTVSVAEGIRQNLDNQKPDFIRPFFTTLQWVMAGNDTEGLRYGTIETPEKYYLTWKEEDPTWTPGDAAASKYLPGSACDGGEGPLGCALLRLAEPRRFLELVHDFTVFDAGTKKLCRHNQYFGVRAAREFVRRRKGGIVWHTQGSGKSLNMVWLAKWIREHVKGARVLIVTDRTELDEQIEKVFLGVNEEIYRASSGADLVHALNGTLTRKGVLHAPWLLCSLVHKFGRGEEEAMEKYVEEVRASLPTGFHAKGELFVFVDEAHRTQSGKLHGAMKAILPTVTFTGFTGTPLLKADKATTLETFGPYIHTYKFDEAVRDGVVLDLRYEARDIDQNITSQKKIDQWFDAKTRGLSDLAKRQLKEKWGTMKRVLSSRSRLEKIVADILFDMETRDRLMSGHGNAMLVSGSIYQACRLYELFSRTHLKGRCAIITSYKPSPGDIKGEETGEGLTERLTQYQIYREMLADYFGEPEETAMYRVEKFETEVKKKFIEQPGQMKLLIVVDKLLTGFDAPPATYLYIDKKMRDHGLFQAICRVNRLDGEDKEYGYVIDYKDLFQSLEGAIGDYTGGALDGYDSADVAGLLENRLDKARERLEEARETIKALCEPVAPPKNTADYLHYFYAVDTTDKGALKENEPRRLALYKAVATLLRAYANLANEMVEAGYSESEAAAAKAEVEYYEKVREEVKLASGDYIDTKVFEPAMRHLLDAYIRAEDSEDVSSFDGVGLVEMFAAKGLGALMKLPGGIRGSEEAMAETIENNVRRVIIDEQAVNPKYYETMSALLDALIRERKAKAVQYAEYLDRLAELARKVAHPTATASYPPSIDTAPKRALFDNLEGDEVLAARIDDAVRSTKKADWRGNPFKERQVKAAVHEALGEYAHRTEQVFELIKNQRAY
jgi:type I restriction enzyme R subunit